MRTFQKKLTAAAGAALLATIGAALAQAGDPSGSGATTGQSQSRQTADPKSTNQSQATNPNVNSKLKETSSNDTSAPPSTAGNSAIGTPATTNTGAAPRAARN